MAKKVPYEKALNGDGMMWSNRETLLNEWVKIWVPTNRLKHVSTTNRIINIFFLNKKN